ncbi:MAG TPA: response regulator transcription factor [Candidatus Obscuribacterales bacterium]
MAKILIVEDEQALVDVMTDLLKGENFLVDHVVSGDDALRQLSFCHYDLIILDWNIPGTDGLGVLRKFRTSGGSAPVLMLTGKREIDDKETGLDAGADDYLTKPFHMRELTARVRALLRRGATTVSKKLVARGLELDPITHQVTLNGEEIELLPKEFALLEFFMRHPKEVFSAEALLQRVWPTDSEAAPSAIRIYITRLRSKIDEKNSPSLISTIHGVGYRFDP